MSPRNSREINNYEKFGLVSSLCVHFCVFAWALFFSRLEIEDIETPIYSVTMEGGKTIGGRMQVAKDEKKTQVAPPKNVAEEQHKQEKKEEKKEEIKPKEPEKIKEEPKKELEDDKDAVPIEKPTVAPTTAPKKEETKEEKKEEQKKADKQEVKKGEAKKEPPVDINKEYQKAMQRYLGDSTEAGGNGFGAAKLGGNAMGGGIVKPREFFIYLEKLKNALKGHWTWYDKSNLLIATVTMEIAQDGTVTGSRIKKSSGNSLFDDSVLRAVREASPVPPPPAIVYNDFKLVDIVFDPRE